MTVLATVLAAAAVAVLLAGGRAGARRLPRIEERPVRSRRDLAPSAACAVAGVAVAFLVGFPAGLVLGGLVGVAGPAGLSRLEPAATRRDREQLSRDQPLVLDLLAACLAGGASLTSAAAAVGAAVPGPCGTRLLAVHGALSVGTAPDDAWLLLGGPDPDDPLTPAARLLARAAVGGTPVSAAVGRLAAEARAISVARGALAARRVGILVVAPLGLCFLPAFVLVGIVPVVAGLAAPLLQGF